MRRGTTTRNQFLQRIRSQLAQDPQRDAVPLPAIDRRAASGSDLLSEFMHSAANVGVGCETVDNTEQLLQVLNEKLKGTAAQSVAISDSSLLAPLVADIRDGCRVVDRSSGLDELFDAHAGITTAQWGIAETGTLVLQSSAERHRLMSLIPPVHIAVLPESRLAGTMSDVLQHMANSNRPDHVVTFITGPSRTADIELTLVVGVHGPVEVHVVILRNA